MVDNAPLLLALDFGGTKHSLALLRRHALVWQAHRRVAAPANADATVDTRLMVTHAEELLAGKQPAAIGVSFGGPVDSARGVVIRSDHVPGWENFPLQQMIETHFDTPAIIDNDANAAALGVYHYGVGCDAKSLFYVTVSTGVGGGWVIGGKVWRGSESMAGEIGHTVVDMAGPRCLCGKRGCVERFASGPYMAQDAQAILDAQAKLDEQAIFDEAKKVDSPLRRLVGDSKVTGQLLCAAAELGDAVALQILQRGAGALGIGLGNAANLMNPDLIVLGGGVTKCGPIWWQGVQQAFAETALPDIKTKILRTVLGDDTPLWGAAALATMLI